MILKIKGIYITDVPIKIALKALSVTFRAKTNNGVTTSLPVP